MGEQPLCPVEADDREVAAEHAPLAAVQEQIDVADVGLDKSLLDPQVQVVDERLHLLADARRDPTRAGRVKNEDFVILRFENRLGDADARRRDTEHRRGDERFVGRRQCRNLVRNHSRHRMGGIAEHRPADAIAPTTQSCYTS